MNSGLRETKYINESIIQHCDAKNLLLSQNGTLFSHVWRWAGWHLIPCRISLRSEFFPRAHKNWHIMWGINLWPDWPPLARGSKFHTIHTPTKAASLPPLEQWKIWTSRFRRNNINYSSRQFRFPVSYFKGINRTILSEHVIRRIEAEKETWHNKFVANATNNNFKHVGTLKYINLLLHIDIHLQRIKYIINE